MQSDFTFPKENEFINDYFLDYSSFKRIIIKINFQPFYSLKAKKNMKINF